MTVHIPPAIAPAHLVGMAARQESGKRKRAEKRGFWQRFAAMARISGPQAWPSLLASTEEIKHAARVVRGEADGDMERATYLVDACIHPDTGEVMPLPFRMAAHVPVNTVLLAVMLGARSVTGTALGQLANQSFNAAQFWVNKNRSNAVDDATFFASFAGSVVASVGVGIALRRWEIRTAGRLAGLGALGWFAAECIPLAAAGVAKPIQIGILRRDELATGITVRLPESGAVVMAEDGSGEVRSRAAGTMAVATTVASRVAYLVPPMVIPPLILAALRPVLRSLPPLATPLVLVLSCACLSAVTTPLCLALWEREMEVPSSSLEPGVVRSAAAMAAATGERADTLVFNKGL